MPDIDYMTNFAVWLNVQNGATSRASKCRSDPQFRYIRNGRDLAEYSTTTCSTRSICRGD